ncbi:MAG: hypothetical protein OXH29_02250 [bacterium]|nr:hypothetical protein [bacterium]
MTETKKTSSKPYRQDMTLVEPFAGPIVVDETCAVGRTKSRNTGVRRQRSSGCGSVDKTAMVSVKDGVSDRVATTLVINADMATLQSFATDHAEMDAMIYANDHKACRGLPRHATVCHSVSEVDKSMIGQRFQPSKLAAP